LKEEREKGGRPTAVLTQGESCQIKGGAPLEKKGIPFWRKERVTFMGSRQVFHKKKEDAFPAAREKHSIGERTRAEVDAQGERGEGTLLT